MQVLLPILYSVLFFVIIYKWRFFSIVAVSRKYLCLLFSLKIMAGVFMVYLYKYYYPYGDMYAFFDDGNKLFAVLIQDPFHFKEIIFNGDTKKELIAWVSNFDSGIFNGSRLMVIINLLIRFVSGGNIYVHVLFFCFFSFIGLISFLKFFLSYYPGRSKSLVIGLFFIPSILFWTSGIQKGALTVLIMGLLVNVSSFGMANYSMKKLTIILLLSLFLFLLKPYILLIYLLVFTINVLVVKTKLGSISLIQPLLFISIALLVLFFSSYSRFNIPQMIADKRAKAISEAKGGSFLVNEKNFISIDFYRAKDILIPIKDSTYKIKTGSDYLSWTLDNMSDTTYVSNSTDTSLYKLMYEVIPAKTVISIKKIEPSVWGLLVHLPEALYNTLLSPSVVASDSIFHVVVWIENGLILLLILLFCISNPFKDISKNRLLFSIIIFCFLLFCLIGLTSPVVGAIIRYRVIGMLFLLPLAIVNTDQKILKRFFRFRA